MRYVFPFLLLASQVAHAQCCPYVEPVQVLPANPTASDDVRLVFQAATGNRGQKISSALTRTGSAFTFTACYYSGLLTSPQRYVDTVRVGQLPAGSYTVAFIARESSDPQQCLETQRNGNSLTFQVNGTTLAALRSAQPQGLLYPVPAAGRQLTYSGPANSNITAFQLYDTTGRECFSRPAEAVPHDKEGFRLELSGLPVGSYSLRVQQPGRPALVHRVVLQ